MVASWGEEGPGSLASVLALPLTRFQGRLGFPGGSMVRNPPVKQETWFLSLVQEDFPWRRKWQPTPVFLPGAFHGQRSLVGPSP